MQTHILRLEEQTKLCGDNMIETMMAFLQRPIVIEVQVWEMVVVAILVFLFFVRLFWDLL